MIWQWQRLTTTCIRTMDSGVWYFQKKVRGREKPYKLSLGTRSVLEARRKRDEYLKQIDQQGFITAIDTIQAPESPVFGEIAVKWADIVKNPGFRYHILELPKNHEQ
jgi:hypothetical protein